MDTQNHSLSLPDDAYPCRIGIQIVKLTDDCVRTSLSLDPTHLNAAGVCHGGVIYGLADHTFALLANRQTGVTYTVTGEIHYLHKVCKGRLQAEARWIDRHARLVRGEVEIRDDMGRPIALFIGTGYRTNVPVTK